MKHPTIKLSMFRSAAALGASLLLAAAVSLQAADQVTFAAAAGSSVKIDGTSSLHAWSMEGRIIGGTFEIEKEFLTDKSLQSVPSLHGQGAPKCNVFIFVRSLKSGKEAMDNRMQTEMKAKEHPRIEYKLTEMKLKGEVPPAGTPVTFDTKGELTIAGVTKPITMEVTLERLEDDKIRFKGQTPLKMTDFNIQPPSFGLGGVDVMTTGDDITVSFDWILKAKS
jgi:polyisoprenoid-binding protein YceI